MLALTKRAGYGIIAMAYLAGPGRGRLASARHIAERFGLPMALMMNVLKGLAGVGLVESIRGARGGYRVTRDPQRVSVTDIIEALEGPIRLAACVEDCERPDGGCACALVDRCPIADPVRRLHQKMQDFLKTATLADMIQPVLEPAERSKPA